ncbi:MAG: cytochrome c biogenesis protein ResB [Fibrobacter sp.]|nr:cytochrome c biogenesis protein ResB [Fibrobacter sp.]
MLYFVRIVKFIGSVKWTVLCLTVLFIGIIGGTFYQVDSGIVAAQKAFFGSWGSLLFNVLPFPGLKSIAVALTLNLIAAAFVKHLFTGKTLGLILIHSGIGFLFFGTGISSLFVNNSTIILCEGERTAISRNLDNWELIVMHNGTDAIRSVPESDTIDFSVLTEGFKIPIPDADYSIIVDRVYLNCKGLGYTENSIDSLEPLPSSYEKTGDIPGIILSITSSDESVNDTNRIMLFGGTFNANVYVINDDTISFSLKPHEISLPFELQLVKFEKENHPGTSNAKSYKSYLKVNGAGINRDVVISMNRPFRYKSLAIYQSGFSQNVSGNNCSSMIVVENVGRIVPYISGVAVVTGLLFYFIAMFISSCKAMRKISS